MRLRRNVLGWVTSKVKSTGWLRAQVTESCKPNQLVLSESQRMMVQRSAIKLTVKPGAENGEKLIRRARWRAVPMVSKKTSKSTSVRVLWRNWSTPVVQLDVCHRGERNSGLPPSCAGDNINAFIKAQLANRDVFLKNDLVAESVITRYELQYNTIILPIQRELALHLANSVASHAQFALNMRKLACRRCGSSFKIFSPGAHAILSYAW
nr:hypothetical protein CFP56_31553 [Quercus suber]